MGEHRLGYRLASTDTEGEAAVKTRYNALTQDPTKVSRQPDIDRALAGEPQSTCNPSLYREVRPTAKRLEEVANFLAMTALTPHLRRATEAQRAELTRRGGNPETIIPPVQGYLADAMSYQILGETFGYTFSGPGSDGFDPLYAALLFSSLGRKTDAVDFIREGMTEEEAISTLQARREARLAVHADLMTVEPLAHAFRYLNNAQQRSGKPTTTPPASSASRPTTQERQSRWSWRQKAGVGSLAVIASVVPIIAHPADASASTSPTSIPDPNKNRQSAGRVVSAVGVDGKVFTIDPIGKDGIKTGDASPSLRGKITQPAKDGIRASAPPKVATEKIAPIDRNSSLEEIAKAAGSATAADKLANSSTDTKSGKVPPLAESNEDLANELKGILELDAATSPANREVAIYLRGALRNPRVLDVSPDKWQQFESGDSRTNTQLIDAKREELRAKYPELNGIDAAQANRLFSAAAILLAANEDASLNNKQKAETTPAPAAPEQKTDAPKGNAPEVGSDQYKEQLIAAVEQAGKNEGWSTEKIRFYRAAAANSVPLNQAAILGGNGFAESGYDTSAKNPSSGASGYFQWLGSRKADYIKFAKEHGVDDPWANSDKVATVQLAFALHELSTDKASYKGTDLDIEKATMREILDQIAAKNAPEAGAGFIMKKFERPSPSEQRNSIGKRTSEARKTFDAFHKLGLDDSLYTGVQSKPQPAAPQTPAPEQPKQPEATPGAVDPASVEGIKFVKTYNHPTNGEVVQLYDIGNGIIVNGDLAVKAREMIVAAEKDGVTLTGWGWRSYERQAELRISNGCPDVHESPSSSCKTPTARPGNSNHEIGGAIDFHVNNKSITKGTKQFKWLQTHAKEFGYYNLPSESWHWSLNGK